MSGDRDIVDKRLEDTLELFAPTDRQAAAAEETQAKAEHAPAPKSRRWDKDNPAFAFRIRPEDDERIGELASTLGWTRDEVARGLIGAALEAVDTGALQLDIERRTVVKETPVRTKGGQTTRRYHSTEAAVKWEWGSEGKFGGGK